MNRSPLTFWLTTVLLAVASAASAQVRLPRPTITAPTTLAYVTQIWGVDGLGHTSIYWTPIPGATGYRITRVINSIDRPTETSLAEDEPNFFQTPAAKAPPSGGLTGAGANLKFCDLQLLPQETAACAYWDYEVQGGNSYSYRVWALYPNGVVAAPSPVATVAYTRK